MEVYKMCESFVNCLHYYSVEIDFTDKITILFLEYDSEYCLYDGNEQDFFKTKEDLLQNIKWLLDRHEAMEVRIMGSYGGNGCCVYKK